jgi:hypothetical protein
MLIDLVKELVRSQQLRRDIAIDAPSVISRYNLTVDEKRLLLKGDIAALATSVGKPLATEYQAVMKDIIIRPFYPEVAHLHISSIVVTPTPTDPLTCKLDLAVDWVDSASPEHGLPSWTQVRVYDATGAEVDRDRTHSFVVPSTIDLVNGKAAVSRTLTFPGAGAYTVVADASGSQDVLPSQAYPINI